MIINICVERERERERDVFLHLPIMEKFFLYNIFWELLDYREKVVKVVQICT